MAEQVRARPGHNGFDPAKLKQFVGDIERIEDEIETLRGEFMNRCKGKRELIGEILDLAKEAGVPKKELRAVLKSRALEEKIKRLRDGLPDEGPETYDQIRFALGDLADMPLGRAALGDDDEGGEPPAPSRKKRGGHLSTEERVARNSEAAARGRKRKQTDLEEFTSRPPEDERSTNEVFAEASALLHEPAPAALQ